VRAVVFIDLGVEFIITSNFILEIDYNKEGFINCEYNIISARKVKPINFWVLNLSYDREAKVPYFEGGSAGYLVDRLIKRVTFVMERVTLG